MWETSGLRRALLLAALVAGAGAVSAETGPEGEARLQRLEDQMRALQDELAVLRRGGAAPAEESLARVEEELEGVQGALARVKIGGYASVRAEANSLAAQKNTFTFRRLVFTTDAEVAPRLRFYSELEYERFRKLELERKVEATAGGLKLEQEVEGTADSEIALEQAWLEWELDPRARLQAGGVLVPLGRFNLNHDDNQWNLPRRTLVDRGVPVLPSTGAWDELGMGLRGTVPWNDQSFTYHLYVVNGATLEAELEEIAQTRDPRRNKLELEAKFTPQTGTFSNDTKEAKALTGRFAFEPALGHELAVSFYTGRYTPDYLADRSVTSLAFDGITHLGGLEIEGEVVTTHYGGTRSVARSFAARAVEKESATPSAVDPDFEAEIEFELTGLAKRLTGYWVEVRHPFWPSFLPRGGFDDPRLVPTLRFEQVWFDDRLVNVDFTGGTLTDLETEDRMLGRGTVGLAYRPTPLVVFTAAYEYTFTDSGESLDGLTNFLAAEEEDSAHAFLLGASFGF